ncbi:MAG: hypothetical protein QOG67_3131 [Verrucomicrobiota bacterium]|jgi:predicted O-methyltransferase YrrM
MNKSKILSLSKIPFRFARNPRSVISRLADEQEDYRHQSLKRYGRQALPTANILDVVPQLHETLNHYTYLVGGAPVTDIALLKALARKYESCDYLEIGTWRGESVVNVAEVARQCVCLTLSKDELQRRGLPENMISETGKFLSLRDNIRVIWHNSLTFDFRSLEKKFDLIFIDGDHSYEGVRSDTVNALRCLRGEESILVWHDYGASPEHVDHVVLAGILDGVPREKHGHLIHVSNTQCALLANRHFAAAVSTFPSIAKNTFTVEIVGEGLRKGGSAIENGGKTDSPVL